MMRNLVRNQPLLNTLDFERYLLTKMTLVCRSRPPKQHRANLFKQTFSSVFHYSHPATHETTEFNVLKQALKVTIYQTDGGTVNENLSQLVP